eukprot:31089-Pelagococcus_subviridis.AAC.12
MTHHKRSHPDTKYPSNALPLPPFPPPFPRRTATPTPDPPPTSHPAHEYDGFAPTLPPATLRARPRVGFISCRVTDTPGAAAVAASGGTYGSGAGTPSPGA